VRIQGASGGHLSRRDRIGHLVNVRLEGIEEAKMVLSSSLIIRIRSRADRDRMQHSGAQCEEYSLGEGNKFTELFDGLLPLR